MLDLIYQPHDKLADLLATEPLKAAQNAFPTENFGEKADYSNYDRNTWEPHHNDRHQSKALTHLIGNTQVERKKLKLNMESDIQFYWNCLVLMLLECVSLTPCTC